MTLTRRGGKLKRKKKIYPVEATTYQSSSGSSKIAKMADTYEAVGLTHLQFNCKSSLVRVETLLQPSTTMVRGDPPPSYGLRFGFFPKNTDSGLF